jgi:hypothetical protein
MSRTAVTPRPRIKLDAKWSKGSQGKDRSEKEGCATQEQAKVEGFNVVFQPGKQPMTKKGVQGEPADRATTKDPLRYGDLTARLGRDDAAGKRAGAECD